MWSQSSTFLFGLNNVTTLQLKIKKWAYLSCESGVPLEKFAPIPVWEQTQLNHPQLLQLAVVPHPYFEDNEGVFLCSNIFLAMCQNFEITPVFYMFASWHHHQFNIKNTHAEEYKAFNYHWYPVAVMYMNPPWSLLDQVIDKIIADKSTVLLVTPRWFETRWYKKMTKLRRERRHWNQAIYLDKNGSLQKRPRWATVFILIPGRDAYNVS